MPCSRIQRRRARATSARCRSAACRLFFKGDVRGGRENARASCGWFESVACAALRPSPPKSGPAVGQSESSISLRKLFQWRNASSTRLRHSALAFVPALQPLYRRTHAHLETFSRLAPRRTAFHSFDNAFPQITRIGLRHRPPPQRRINAQRSRSSLTLWESRRFKSDGNRYSRTLPTVLRAILRGRLCAREAETTACPFNGFYANRFSIHPKGALFDARYRPFLQRFRLSQTSRTRQLG